MFKALKKMFPGDDWQDTRRSVTQDANWWKKLREGAKVEFTSVPQSSISNAELSIKNTQYYDFDNSSFVSYMLHDGSKLQCQVIVAQQGDNSTYLAISRHLSEDELYRICSQEDIKLLTQPRHLKRLYVREQAMGLDGWLSMRYSKKLDNIRGSKTVNDQERSFDYTLLVSDDNSKAIEVERYHDGRCEIYVTVYRPVTDIIDITGGSAFASKRGIADMSNAQHTVSIPALNEQESKPVNGPALTRDDSKVPTASNDDTIMQANISAASQNIVEKTTSAPLPKSEKAPAMGQPAAQQPKKEAPIQVKNPLTSANKTTEFSRKNVNTVPPVSETLKAVAKEVNKEFVTPARPQSANTAPANKPIERLEKPVTKTAPKPLPIPEVRKERKAELPTPKPVEFKQAPKIKTYEPKPLKTPSAKLDKMIDSAPAASASSISSTKKAIEKPVVAPTAPLPPKAAKKPVKKSSLAIEDIKREIEAKIQDEIKRELTKKNGGKEFSFPHNITQKKKEIVENTRSEEKLQDNPKAPSPDKVVVKRVKREKIDCNMRVAGKIIDEAVRRDMHLADVMRNVLGLPINASDEVTLHLPLSTDDYKALGERYKISPDSRNKIKRRIIADLAGFAGENKRMSEGA